MFKVGDLVVLKKYLNDGSHIKTTIYFIHMVLIRDAVYQIRTVRDGSTLMEERIANAMEIESATKWIRAEKIKKIFDD